MLMVPLLLITSIIFFSKYWMILPSFFFPLFYKPLPPSSTLKSHSMPLSQHPPSTTWESSTVTSQLYYSWLDFLLFFFLIFVFLWFCGGSCQVCFADEASFLIWFVMVMIVVIVVTATYNEFLGARFAEDVAAGFGNYFSSVWKEKGS